MKVAIIVGHSEKSQGAENRSGVSEFQFNNKLAAKLCDILASSGINVVTIYRDTYAELPSKVNSTEPDIAISLHCNAFNTHVSGSEVLYYHKSKSGERLAEAINYQIVSCLNLNNRGLKPIQGNHVGSKGDKGGHLVQNTAMPCVILEPMFIDNDTDLYVATQLMDDLAQAIFEGIMDYADSRFI